MSFLKSEELHHTPHSQNLFIRCGDLVTRLAKDSAEIEEAQKLRYKIFYDELGAHPTPRTQRCQRDEDEFDAYADHLLVLRNPEGSTQKEIVATYRLLRRSVAHKLGYFYSANEYDLRLLKNVPGEILEVGRSCVAKNYRGKTVVQLLWEGIAFYIQCYKIPLLFGCASFHTIDPNKIARELTYLYTHRLAPANIRVRALENLYVPMSRVDPTSLSYAQLHLPPLIKGYLRLGGFVGDGAVIDPQFNTTDIAILVGTQSMTDKYFNHYRRRLTHALDE